MAFERIGGWIAVVALVFGLIAAAEGVAHYVLRVNSLAATVVDIQTPETLCLKLDLLDHFKGRKVVLLGDSLAFGQAMRDHGNAAWRDEELSHALAATLPPSERTTMVLNLGLNGGLPADQLRILELIGPGQLDLLVSILSIRSFASDFAAEDKALSRPWLAEVARRPNGGCVITQHRGNRFDRFVRKIASESTTLFGAGDLVQRLIFDDSLRDAAKRWRSSFQSLLSRSDPLLARDDAKSAETATLLLARGRFQRINFNSSSMQVAAMQALAANAANAASDVIFFYGNKSPRRLVSLIARRDYERHRASLAALIPPGCHTRYIADFHVPDALYIDYAHVNAEGYRLMAGEIRRELDRPGACSGAS